MVVIPNGTTLPKPLPTDTSNMSNFTKLTSVENCDTIYINLDLVTSMKQMLGVTVGGRRSPDWTEIVSENRIYRVNEKADSLFDHLRLNHKLKI